MIALGCDHAGFFLMQELKDFLDEQNVKYKDFGTYDEESCDYTFYAEAAAGAVASGQCEAGLLICGSGVGISIAANKIPGIRAALCSDCFSAEMSRRHNDANVLALGAKVVGSGLARKILKTFLNTGFDGGRHARRVGLIGEMETRYGRKDDK
jgi:ribose 5-phosphate isomerase B